MNEEDLQKEQNAAVSVQEKRRNRLRCAMIVVVALLFAVGCFFMGMLAGRGKTDAQMQSLLWMVDTIEENYREEVTRDELYDRLYDSLALDKFCTHYTPEEYAEKVRASNGQNSGIGISLTSIDGHVRVSRTVGNSPVELAGIEKGMYVYSCNGQVPQSPAEAIELLEEAEGDAVLSCGWNADGSDAREYTVRRADYLAAYCAYADSEATFRFRGSDRLVLTETGSGISALPAGTAYIALSKFEGKAGEEFGECLARMRGRGRTDLIIDLRGNGGGYLSILCEIASYLLRNAEGSSPLVMQARYRNGGTVNYRATGNRFSQYFNADSRITVLADENSASASEALMGVLIDYGTCSYSDFYLRESGSIAKTYGKGVMQSHFKAPDGNVLLLTVADIYWPKGRCIHGIGITEADGAIGVEAPALPGAEDVFLQTVCAKLA